MALCPKLPKCPFFNSPVSQRMSVAVNSQKRRFCETDNSECARLWLCNKKGPNAVPLDLFPTQMAVARQLAGE